MRLRLVQNFSFNSHTEASRARDNLNSNTVSQEPGVPVNVAKEAVLQNAGDDRLEDEDIGGGMTPPPR